MSKVRATTALNKLSPANPNLTINDILELGEKPEGSKDTSMVDLDLVELNLSLRQNAEDQSLDVRRKNPHVGNGLKGFRVLPGDKVILAEVQAWADSHILPADFVPDLQPQGDDYFAITPSGHKVVFNAAEAAQIRNGKRSIEEFSFEAAYSEIGDNAKKLQNLSFHKLNCEICNKPMTELGPWIAIIHRILQRDQVFVLPYSDRFPRPGTNDRWILFRKAHLVCRLTADKLKPVLTGKRFMSDTDMATIISDSVPEIMKEAMAKQPKLTRNEILDRIGDVLTFIGA